ncbi:cysteine desulfurase family protein [Evansella cellulosilytica]|uniref:Cysteine desulfurase n=1 Tax=Evansella cellulosilytica (strain ATCC 21833 / DSM 2522 / FERM P-1141 / JCM 9156 / N-4) TaxID=649639 RepID=E6U151_EVAC2|nr:cysteine desulfurase family protein [Evansella cellulosilytica]ADU31497.1 Cysteine desulfurase [Evansella cellulosilytica DSM 2522]
MIYFDNSATTKPYIEVIETYTKVSTEFFGNPSSLHPLGKASERLLNQARDMMANLMQIKPQEIIFTSGGTEGNNLAIKGAVYRLQSRGNHLITTSVEHASVLEVFRQLEQEGFSVTYLEPNNDGIITEKQVKEAINEDTVLVSIIHVNNEVGTINPIQSIGKMLKEYPKVLFHVDHVQGIGKVPLNFHKSYIDLCTISAHKFHGIKGNGALFIREGIRLHPLLNGGSQERKIRAGTENVPGAVAMVKALRLSLDNKNKLDDMRQINGYLEKQCAQINGVVINSPKERAPHLLNISIPGVKPEVLVQALAEKNIYVSTKSACSSKLSEPSKVLLAMGYDEDRASSAIRLSLSYDNTKEEANEFLRQFKTVVELLKKVVEK